MNPITADRIREVVVCIAGDIAAHISACPQTGPNNERSLWIEMSCCVLSSQVPYELAKAAALRIDEAGVLWAHRSLKQELLKRKLTELLSEPFSADGTERRYRFPNIRASQMAAAFWTVRKQWGSLCELLSEKSNARNVRACLAMHVPGIGPKQASMFLRNGAGSFDLAILDRHVLRYMAAIKLCSADVSQVATIKRYEKYENHLQDHAESLGYPVGLLDWAIWIVMRTACRMDRQWAS